MTLTPPNLICKIAVLLFSLFLFWGLQTPWLDTLADYPKPVSDHALFTI